LCLFSQPGVLVNNSSRCLSTHGFIYYKFFLFSFGCPNFSLEQWKLCRTKESGSKRKFFHTQLMKKRKVWDGGRKFIKTIISNVYISKESQGCSFFLYKKTERTIGKFLLSFLLSFFWGSKKWIEFDGCLFKVGYGIFFGVYSTSVWT